MENNYTEQLTLWIEQDELRMCALKAASKVALMFQIDDHLLAAGFVRNLAWDKLHCLTDSALSDIDFIYFDLLDISIQTEKKIEQALTYLLPESPWSVKNQARMHEKNGDAPYTSIKEAMSYWPEKETAIGVKLVNEEVQFVSAFGLDSLFKLKITHNSKREVTTFQQRVKEKNWLYKYSLLSLS
ncbi:MAG: nucleotidyltransferase family protein [Shewanella sp.]|nr:nucleotidyltransferase family protein [Shewanella sp.]